jgi:hypothetical protein
MHGGRRDKCANQVKRWREKREIVDGDEMREREEMSKQAYEGRSACCTSV